MRIAPQATATMINVARRRRGAPPVPEDAEEESALSLADLKRIAASVA